MRRYLLIAFLLLGCWEKTPPRLSLEESELLWLLSPTVSAFFSWKTDSAAFQSALKSLGDGAQPILPAALGAEVLNRRGFSALVAALEEAHILSLAEPIAIREGLIFSEAGTSPEAAAYLLVNASVSLSQFITVLTAKCVTTGVALTRETFVGGTGYRLAAAPQPPGDGDRASERPPLFLSAEGEYLAIATDRALIERFLARRDYSSMRPSLFQDPQFGALSDPLRTSEQLLSLGFLSLSALFRQVPIETQESAAIRNELIANFPVRAVAFGTSFSEGITSTARLLVQSEGEVQQRWIQAVASGAQSALVGALARDSAISIALAGGVVTAVQAQLLAEQPIEKQRALEPLMAALDGVSGIALDLQSDDGMPAGSFTARCGDRCSGLDAQVRKILGQTLALNGAAANPWRPTTVGGVTGVTLESTLGLSLVLLTRDQTLVLATSPAAAASAMQRSSAGSNETLSKAAKLLDRPASILAGRLVPDTLVPLLRLFRPANDDAQGLSSDTVGSDRFLGQLESAAPMTFALSTQGNVWELGTVYDTVQTNE